MANPTTNFGWVMPTSASLVTNLPADFNVFGQGVDTSMQYLLGGTTGQVLSKTSGTNMAFTWTTPTDQTPLTTKGDLFTFTTVDARLAVGANDTALVADSTQSTGLAYKTKGVFNGLTTTGDTIYSSSGTTQSRLGIGSTGQVLTVAAGIPSWATPAAASAIGASVYNQGGNISYTSGVETLLTATTSDYDTNSFWAVSPNPSRLTIPSGYAGKYLLTITTRVNAGGTYAYMFLYKNGARVATGLESGFIARQLPLGGNSTVLTGTVVLNCAVADYFQVYFQSDVTTGNQTTWMRYTLSYQGA